MKRDCIFFEAEPIGGTEKHTQWGYYCRAKDSYNDDIDCVGCSLYEAKGGEKC